MGIYKIKYVVDTSTNAAENTLAVTKRMKVFVDAPINSKKHTCR